MYNYVVEREREIHSSKFHSLSCLCMYESFYYQTSRLFKHHVKCQSQFVRDKNFSQRMNTNLPDRFQIKSVAINLGYIIWYEFQGVNRFVI